MKKKLLALSLVAVLIAIAVVGGSLAYFMDEDKATNVFSIGSVEIVQNEEFDEESAILLPVIGTDPTNENDNYIEKKVTVTNTGKNDAYVQTYVAVPQVLDETGILKIYDGDLATKGWTKVDGNTASDGIQPVATGVTVDGETLKYNVYLYRYNSILAATNPDTTTTANMEYVYIDPATDLNVYDTDNNGESDSAYFVMNGIEITEFNAADLLNVYVATQAVQAQGFTDADSALDSAFSAHPWA